MRVEIRYPLRKKKIVTPSPPGTRASRPEWPNTTSSTEIARMPSRDGMFSALWGCTLLTGAANPWARSVSAPYVSGAGRAKVEGECPGNPYMAHAPRGLLAEPVTCPGLPTTLTAFINFTVSVFVTVQIGISRIISVFIHALVLHIVLGKMIHVGFVEHSTNDGLMQIRRRIERMPHNV